MGLSSGDRSCTESSTLWGNRGTASSIWEEEQEGGVPAGRRRAVLIYGCGFIMLTAPARPQPWTSTHQAASNISATWLQAIGTYEADHAASGDAFMILFAIFQT